MLRGSGLRNSRMKQRTLVIIALSIASVAGLYALAYYVALANGVILSFHTWVAIGLGAGLSFAVSIGLFGLSFYSSRSGHDDEIGQD